jgi:hypothetical protein
MFVGLAVFTDISCRDTDTGFISRAFPVHRLSPLRNPKVSVYGNWTVLKSPQTLHYHTKFSRSGDLAPGICALFFAVRYCRSYVG